MLIPRHGWFSIFLFAVYIVIAIALSFGFMFAYAFVSTKPNFFFMSLFLSVFIPALLSPLVRRTRFGCDGVVLTLSSAVCGLVLILTAIFGPVFVDRSISYHLVFYAVEQGSLNAASFRDLLAKPVFDKRMYDAQLAGFLVKTGDDTYVPTRKARYFTDIAMAIGRLSGSLDNYKVMTNRELHHD